MLKILQLCCLISVTQSISFYFNLNPGSDEIPNLNWVINALETNSEYIELKNADPEAHLPVIFIDSLGRQSRLTFLKPITLEQQAKVMIHFTEQDGQFENTDSFDPKSTFLSFHFTKENLKSQGQAHLDQIVDYIKDNFDDVGQSTQDVSVSDYDSQYMIRRDFTGTDYSNYVSNSPVPDKVVHIEGKKTAVFVYLFKESELSDPPKNAETENNHNFIELFASESAPSPGSIPSPGFTIYARMNNWVNSVIEPILHDPTRFSSDEHAAVLRDTSTMWLTPAMVCSDQFLCSEMLALRILPGENNLNNRTGIDWTRLELNFKNLQESGLIHSSHKDQIEEKADDKHVFMASQYNKLVGMTIVRMTPQLIEDYAKAKASPNRTTQDILNDGTENEEIPGLFGTLPPKMEGTETFDLFLENSHRRERELTEMFDKESQRERDRQLNLYRMVKSIEDNPDFGPTNDYFFANKAMVVIFVGFSENIDRVLSQNVTRNLIKSNLLIM